MIVVKTIEDHSLHFPRFFPRIVVAIEVGGEIVVDVGGDAILLR